VRPKCLFAFFVYRKVVEVRTADSTPAGLEGKAYFHSRKQSGDGQHQAGEDQGLRDAVPPVAEVLSKEGNPEQAQDYVPVVRKKIGGQGVRAGRAEGKSPSSSFFDVANPIEQSECGHSERNGVKAPGGGGPDLGNAQRF
jgi:hypothetical protein